MADAPAPTTGADTSEHRPGPGWIRSDRVTHYCVSCDQEWPCDGSWHARIEALEATVADILAIVGSKGRRRRG